jgi:uncharacterized RDD family membrane protein YckC
MSSDAPAPSNAPPELVLASWVDRFIAWLIDFVIVQVALAAVFAAVAFPFWFAGVWTVNSFVPGPFDGPARYLISSAAFFAYWTYFESTRGQSIGKMVMKLRTVDLAGRPIDTRSAAIQSFGKAFLLPIDVILGWIFTNDKRQRIFNRASDSIVIKYSEPQGPQATYRKD